MSGDDVTIIPNDQIQALLTAILAGDTIQEDLELILTDNAEIYLRRKNFMAAMGLKPTDPLSMEYTKMKRSGALLRSIIKENLYTKMRMIAHPELELDYFESRAAATPPADQPAGPAAPSAAEGESSILSEGLHSPTGSVSLNEKDGS